MLVIFVRIICQIDFGYISIRLIFYGKKKIIEDVLIIIVNFKFKIDIKNFGKLIFFSLLNIVLDGNKSF